MYNTLLVKEISQDDARLSYCVLPAQLELEYTGCIPRRILEEGRACHLLCDTDTGGNPEGEVGQGNHLRVHDEEGGRGGLGKIKPSFPPRRAQFLLKCAREEYEEASKRRYMQYILLMHPNTNRVTGGGGENPGREPTRARRGSRSNRTQEKVSCDLFFKWGFPPAGVRVCTREEMN